MAKANVYIAGVGCSSRENAKLNQVSAATKALLDAGITFDDLSHGVRSENVPSSAFTAFDDRESIQIASAASGQELSSAVKAVASGKAQAVLVIASTKNTVGLVVVSEDFVWRHPFLKDSSIIVGEEKSTQASQDDFEQVCKTVWKLRGWTKGESNTKQSVGSLELRTIDAKVPAWKDIEHRQDGKHRLGYNPATVEKDISIEDFEAVRAWRGAGQSKSVVAGLKRKGGDRAALAKL